MASNQIDKLGFGAWQRSPVGKQSYAAAVDCLIVAFRGDPPAGVPDPGDCTVGEKYVAEAVVRR